MQIAIDGPSGSGKSTVAKRLAKKLGYTYLDTGAMYRAIALYALENNIDPNSREIENFLDQIELEFIDNELYLNGINVAKKIRSKEVTDIVSQVSANQKVREDMLNRQREIARGVSVIMDGRDIGTVVLPDADYKFFITASPETRAMRRALQNGNTDNLEQIKLDLIKRDKKDSTRKISPLRRAEDAILIENDDQTIDQTIDIILNNMRNDL